MKLISNSISHPVFLSLSFVVSSGKKKKTGIFHFIKIQNIFRPAHHSLCKRQITSQTLKKKKEKTSAPLSPSPINSDHVYHALCNWLTQAYRYHPHN